jgi:hypothetical protein
MSKEFESKLAKKISEPKKMSKVRIAMAFCAALVVCSAFAVTAALADSNGNQTGDLDGEKDQVQLQLQDGSCGDCDPICPNPDCPCSDE